MLLNFMFVLLPYSASLTSFRYLYFSFVYLLIMYLGIGLPFALDFLAACSKAIYAISSIYLTVSNVPAGSIFSTNSSVLRRYFYATFALLSYFALGFQCCACISARILTIMGLWSEI